ncbi:MAG: GNAT family N-acetyltransferase [Aquabacterium sp.]
MTETHRAPVAGPSLRQATMDDALCLSVLAMQVFLDTYATQGIRRAIAREVLAGYSEPVFARDLADPGTAVWVAEQDGHLIGFVQLRLRAAQADAPAGVQAELLHLYVQHRFTGRRVGARLLAQAEQVAAASGATVLWLTAWVHNLRALRFYARCGYQDCGLAHSVFEGESHENRVLARSIRAPAPSPASPPAASPPGHAGLAATT